MLSYGNYLVAHWAVMSCKWFHVTANASGNTRLSLKCVIWNVEIYLSVYSMRLKSVFVCWRQMTADKAILYIKKNGNTKKENNLWLQIIKELTSVSQPNACFLKVCTFMFGAIKNSVCLFSVWVVRTKMPDVALRNQYFKGCWLKSCTQVKNCFRADLR